MNTLVNFELAKLLKGKGYRVLPDFKSSYPKIAEVVMWMYKKHGIWIYCDETFRPYIIKDGENKIYHGELSRLKKINDVYKAVYIWDSPTEAYEAAIEYTLTNLI